MANNITQPAFRPAPLSTVHVTAGTASSSVQVRTSTEQSAVTRHCRVFNSSAVTIFFETGASTVAATSAASVPLAAGAVEIVSLEGDFAAAISSSAGQVVYFTPGEGL